MVSVNMQSVKRRNSDMLRISGMVTVPKSWMKKLEDYVEIKSDVIPFEQRPWMKSAEITDVLCAAIESGNYDFCVRTIQTVIWLDIQETLKLP